MLESKRNQVGLTNAKQRAPVTAVWTPPGRTQVDICGSCLDERVRTGEWKIEGARVAGMKIRSENVAVYTPDAKLQLVVKVKKRLGTSIEWVTKMYRDMLSRQKFFRWVMKKLLPRNLCAASKYALLFTRFS